MDPMGPVEGTTHRSSPTIVRGTGGGRVPVTSGVSRLHSRRHTRLPVGPCGVRTLRNLQLKNRLSLYRGCPPVPVRKTKNPPGWGGESRSKVRVLNKHVTYLFLSSKSQIGSQTRTSHRRLRVPGPSRTRTPPRGTPSRFGKDSEIPTTYTSKEF